MSPTSAQSGRPAYDSQRLRRIFDRRATTFDDVAFLPREIAQRYRTVAKSLNRADRARLWQIVRRVANRGLRELLDRVYRNEL